MLEAKSPLGNFSEGPEEQEESGHEGCGDGERGNSQGTSGAELPGRTARRHSGIHPSNLEDQAVEEASPRDGELGERSTLREEYNSALDKLRYVGDNSVEMSGRQLHSLIRSRKKI